MTQQVTALLLLKSVSKSCYSVVDLNSILYCSAFTGEVHMKKKGQMNCTLGHVLAYISLGWPSSSDGECLHCCLLYTAVYSFSD